MYVSQEVIMLNSVGNIFVVATYYLETIKPLLVMSKQEYKLRFKLNYLFSCFVSFMAVLCELHNTKLSLNKLYRTMSNSIASNISVEMLALRPGACDASVAVSS